MGPITVSRAVLALLASGVAAMPTINRDLPTPEEVEAPGTPSPFPDNATAVEAPGFLNKIAMNWPYGQQKVRGVNLGGVSYSILPR
jgi:hypothetical protein